MYRQDKARQLENRSHVRGLLSKEFYGEQERQREEKRMRMKAELDQQVEQRKRAREAEQQQQQRRIRKEEEDIRRYHNSLASRDRPQPTFPRSSVIEDVNFVSLRKDNPGKPKRDAVSDRKSVHYQDIPEQIPLMASIDSNEGTYAPPSQQDIPVMPPLEQETRKRRKTKGGKQPKRKQTHSRLDTLGSRKNTESGLKELQMQLQNRKLKEQVRKSEQAIVLMLNAMKTQPKMERIRQQVQKILAGETVPLAEPREQRRSEGSRFFPTLSFNEKSIIKEYMMGAARLARRNVNTTSVIKLVPFG